MQVQNASDLKNEYFEKISRIFRDLDDNVSFSTKEVSMRGVEREKGKRSTSKQVLMQRIDDSIQDKEIAFLRIVFYKGKEKSGHIYQPLEIPVATIRQFILLSSQQGLGSTPGEVPNSTYVFNNGLEDPLQSEFELRKKIELEFRDKQQSERISELEEQLDSIETEYAGKLAVMQEKIEQYKEKVYRLQARIDARDDKIKELELTILKKEKERENDKQKLIKTGGKVALTGLAAYAEKRTGIDGLTGMVVSIMDQLDPKPTDANDDTDFEEVQSEDVNGTPGDDSTFTRGKVSFEFDDEDDSDLGSIAEDEEEETDDEDDSDLGAIAEEEEEETDDEDEDFDDED